MWFVSFVNTSICLVCSLMSTNLASVRLFQCVHAALMYPLLARHKQFPKSALSTFRSIPPPKPAPSFIQVIIYYFKYSMWFFSIFLVVSQKISGHYQSIADSTSGCIVTNSITRANSTATQSTAILGNVFKRCLHSACNPVDSIPFLASPGLFRSQQSFAHVWQKPWALSAILTFKKY